MKNIIPVLVTCHNRKEKTLKCLHSLSEALVKTNISFKIFLVDDGSTDDTGAAVQESFPEVKIINGDGNLYWSGGMRLAYKTAREYYDFNGYLLINDDVVFRDDFFNNILVTKEYCYKKFDKGGVYVGSTVDVLTGDTTYGGNLLVKKLDNPKSVLLDPSTIPQSCHLTNANILYIEKEVIKKISFLDLNFTHGIADYDYSLRAFKAGFPVYLTPGISGYCSNDHGPNWSNSKNLKKRIEYLKDPLGLAYREYLFYIRRHFPNYYTMSIIKLWVKTIFPSIWKIKRF